MELKELQTTLEKFKGDIETRMTELSGHAGDTAIAETKALRNDLNEVQKTLNSVAEQLKIAQSREIPGLAGKEAKKFSFGAAVQAIGRDFFRQKGLFQGDPWAEAGHEKEVIIEAMKKRDMIGGDGTLGGYLIPQEVTNEVIDLAIADMPVMDFGPNVIRGLVGDLPIPKLTGRPTAYWVGETGKPTKSDAGYGMITLRPKKLGAFTVQSNRLIYQSQGVSDTIVRNELRNAIALAAEEAIIKGLGTEKQPKGILLYDNINAMTSLAGARFRVDDMAKMMRKQEVANELKGNMGKYGFLMRPEVKYGLKQERVLNYSGQANNVGQPIMPMTLFMTDKALEDATGVKIRSTTLLSATETAGGRSTSATTLFGNWEMLRIAFWRDFVLKASDVAGDGSTGSAFLDDSLYIVCFQEMDVALSREAAFVKQAGCETDDAQW